MMTRLTWFSLGFVAGVYAAVRSDPVLRATAGKPSADRVMAVMRNTAASVTETVSGLGATSGGGAGGGVGGPGDDSRLAG